MAMFGWLVSKSWLLLKTLKAPLCGSTALTFSLTHDCGRPTIKCKEYSETGQNHD